MLVGAAAIWSGVTPRAARAQDTISGEWRIETRSGRNFVSDKYGDMIHLEMRRDSWGSHSNWGNTIKPGELEGLDYMRARNGDSFEAKFQRKRDAGTTTFTGSFRDGTGNGEFTFSPNMEFAAAMKAMGYGSLSTEKLFTFAQHDVSRKFIQDMRDAGYPDLTEDQLVTFRIHGVSPEYVKEMRGVGFDRLSPDKIVTFRIHGVSAEYAKQMASFGIRDLSPDEIVTMRIHGVTPEFVRDMGEIGRASCRERV